MSSELHKATLTIPICDCSGGRKFFFVGISDTVPNLSRHFMGRLYLTQELGRSTHFFHFLIKCNGPRFDSDLIKIFRVSFFLSTRLIYNFLFIYKKLFSLAFVSTLIGNLYKIKVQNRALFYKNVSFFSTTRPPCCPAAVSYPLCTKYLSDCRNFVAKPLDQSKVSHKCSCCNNFR